MKRIVLGVLACFIMWLPVLVSAQEIPDRYSGTVVEPFEDSYRPPFQNFQSRRNGLTPAQLIKRTHYWEVPECMVQFYKDRRNYLLVASQEWIAYWAWYHARHRQCPGLSGFFNTYSADEFGQMFRNTENTDDSWFFGGIDGLRKASDVYTMWAQELKRYGVLVTRHDTQTQWEKYAPKCSQTAEGTLKRDWGVRERNCVALWMGSLKNMDQHVWFKMLSDRPPVTDYGQDVQNIRYLYTHSPFRNYPQRNVGFWDATREYIQKTVDKVQQINIQAAHLLIGKWLEEQRGHHEFLQAELAARAWCLVYEEGSPDCINVITPVIIEFDAGLREKAILRTPDVVRPVVPSPSVPPVVRVDVPPMVMPPEFTEANKQVGQKLDVVAQQLRDLKSLAGDDKQAQENQRVLMTVILEAIRSIRPSRAPQTTSDNTELHELVRQIREIQEQLLGVARSTSGTIETEVRAASDEIVRVMRDIAEQQEIMQRQEIAVQEDTRDQVRELVAMMDALKQQQAQQHQELITLIKQRQNVVDRGWDWVSVPAAVHWMREHGRGGWIQALEASTGIWTQKPEHSRNYRIEGDTAVIDTGVEMIGTVQIPFPQRELVRSIIGLTAWIALAAWVLRVYISKI